MAAAAISAIETTAVRHGMIGSRIALSAKVPSSRSAVGAALVAALIVNANTGTAWAKEGQNQHYIRLS